MRRSVLLGLAFGICMGSVTEGGQRRAAPRFRCTPAVLGPGEMLNIQMPIPHGRELGVWTADDRFLFIAYDSDEPVNPVPAPVAAASFVSMTSLELPVSAATGVELSYSHGKAGPETIFTKFGTYRFIVSDNLETEDDLHKNIRCEVRYKSSRKK